jgi:hypothetical protein
MGDRVGETETGNLRDLVKRRRDLDHALVPCAALEFAEDRRLVVFARADDEWEAETRAILRVEPLEACDLVRRKPVETR